MKPTKLTQAHKEAIKSKLLARKFDPLFAAQKAREAAFADRLLTQAQPHDLSTFPEGWFYESSALRVIFDGWQKLLSLSSMQRQTYSTSTKGLQVRQGTPEFAEQKDLEQAHDVLKAQKKDLGREIDAVLRTVNTTKRLAEIWPEAVELLPELPAPVPAVVNIDALREALNG